jgi:hypothetical protein
MAWGSARHAGIDDIVERLRRDDAGLTSLYLMRTRRFDETDARALGQALGANRTLEELHLSSHPVSVSQARALAAGLADNGSLRLVSIGTSTFGDEALVALCEGLEKSASLRTLDLEKKGLTEASCGPLCGAVLASGSIREVFLSDNHIGGRGVADFLPCASRLEALSLCSCLEDASQWAHVAEAMARTLPGARDLRILELDRNALDEGGAAAIAGSLSRLPSLEALSLNGNPDLGPRGVRSLAFPRSLRRLDLGSTGAADEGLLALAELLALGELPNVDYINVCGNGATADGLMALLDGLAGRRTGPGPVELDAGGTDLSTGAGAVTGSVLRCRCLRSLRLHGCSLGSEGAQALAALFAPGEEKTKKWEDATHEIDATHERDAEGLGAHALRDVDISGNGIPETGMLGILDALPHAVADVFPRLKNLIIAANPGVEGAEVAGRVEALGNLGVVVMRAANDGRH